MTVLNKHMDHMKTTNSHTVQEQNMPSSSTALVTVPEPMDSPSPSTTEDTSESEMGMVDVTASMPLLFEKENEFLFEDSGIKRQATGGLADRAASWHSGWHCCLIVPVIHVRFHPWVTIFVEFALSPCVCVGFLLLSKDVQIS
eukprot:g34218.t1